MFKSIKKAFQNIFKPPVTIKYPVEPIIKEKNYRGLIEYNKEECIFCLKCEKACPPTAIIFDKNDDDTKTYTYDPYLCIYCGECVRACPKPDLALWHSNKKPPIKYLFVE